MEAEKTVTLQRMMQEDPIRIIDVLIDRVARLERAVDLLSRKLKAVTGEEN